MKKLLHWMTILALVAMISESKAVQTNYVGLIDSPPQFAEMSANTNIFPGLYPAAIYRFKDNKVNFACMGSMFQEGTNSFSIILPEHVFNAKEPEDYAYGVRIMRPDNHRIDGFVGNIEMKSTDIFGCDMVIAGVTNCPVPIKRFSKRSNIKNIIVAYTSTIISKGKEVRQLRSLVTGKPAKILGYGFKPTEQLLKLTHMNPMGQTVTVDEDHPLIAIEDATIEGDSGGAYFDENRRIFIVSGSVEVSARMLKTDKGDLIRIPDKTIRITLLTGPVMLENESSP